MCNLKTMRAVRLHCLRVAVLTAGLACTAVHAAETEMPITFSGGHEIGRNDYGRPIALIAAALNVEPDVFREAFSGVTPAHGRGPSQEEARRNKSALMKVLAPRGVTNDRLDEVSNYYRYQPQRGNLWRTTPAKAHAVVVNGKIRSIVVTEPGSGYCNPPEATVQGLENVTLKVMLHFDVDLRKNGGVASVEVAKASTSRNAP
jgi:hypothetical protein